MKISSRLALLTTLALACTAPVKAQNHTYSSMASGAAAGQQNNTNYQRTGIGATGTPNTSALNMQSSGNGLTAPGTVNGSGFPSGSYNYGFSSGYGVSAGTPSQYGSLPMCSTGSVDLNIVDNSNYVQYTGNYAGYGFSGTGSGGVTGSGSPSTLAGLGASLPGSTFAQVHPRRTEVLEGDSALLNQITSDYGNLSGQFYPLANQAMSIENQEEADAAANGGYITQQQQAQLNQEESALSQSVSNDIGPPPGNSQLSSAQQISNLQSWFSTGQ